MELIGTMQKERGEIAEAIFLGECEKKGIRVSRPFGDTLPYDCITDFNGVMRKVQVKSTSCMVTESNKTYFVNARKGGGNTFGPYGNEIDVLAVYIVPEDVWFIIPAKAVTVSSIKISLLRKEKNRFSKYRDNWSELMLG